MVLMQLEFQTPKLINYLYRIHIVAVTCYDLKFSHVYLVGVLKEWSNHKEIVTKNLHAIFPLRNIFLIQELPKNAVNWFGQYLHNIAIYSHIFEYRAKEDWETKIFFEFSVLLLVTICVRFLKLRERVIRDLELKTLWQLSLFQEKMLQITGDEDKFQVCHAPYNAFLRNSSH